MLKLLSRKPTIVLLLIPLLITGIWFRNGLIHGGGEEGLIFYNSQKTFLLSKSVWVDYGTGMFIYGWLPRIPTLYLASIFTKIGLPPFLFQTFIFYLLMEIGLMSVYYLTLYFTKKNLISFIAALFYLFNPFAMSQIWGRSLSTQYFAFALLPLSLLLFCLGLNRRKYIYGILIALVSSLLPIAFEFLTFIIVFWLVFLIYLLNKKEEIIFGLKFLLFTFILWCLFNSWWLVPLLLSFSNVYSAAPSGPNENLGSLLGVSRSFPFDVIIRLLHKGYFFDSTAFSKLYLTIPFQFISLIPVLFVSFGVYYVVRNKLKHFRFFLVLLALGLFVSLGANFPTGWLFIWLFKHISPLQAFRNPFEKFGLVFALGYSVLFAQGLVAFIEKKKLKNLILTVVIILTCGVYAFPMWTGRVIAGPDKKIGIDVPKDYHDLQNLLKEKGNDYRVFMTPFWSGDGAYYQWGSAGRYQGNDPMNYMLDQSVISNNIFGFNHEFLNSLRKNMVREDVVPILSLLRVKYLVDRKDAIFISDREKEQYNLLTSTIYTKSLENNLKSICQNIVANSKDNNGVAWIVCHIPAENSDLSGISYLDIKIKTDIPANLEIALRDKKDVRVNWHGRIDPDYQTDGKDFQNITISLATPSENDPSFDSSKSDILEVWAYSKDNPEKSVDQINISEIKLDPGIPKNINEFNKIGEFGKLTVFEPVNFNPPPEFGSLSSVNLEKDSSKLFEDLNQKRNLTDKEGFVLISQNQEKNLEILANSLSLQIIDKSKISDTRYWLKTNSAPGLILLSKSFNPQWKAVAGVSKEKLNGNIFDDLKLLKMAVLSEDKHFVVNGYGNLWKVDSDGEYAILFMPQVVSDIATKASVFSIILVLGITLVFKFSRFFLKR